MYILNGHFANDVIKINHDLINLVPHLLKVTSYMQL